MQQRAHSQFSQAYSRRLAAVLALTTLGFLPLAAAAAEPGQRPPARAEMREEDPGQRAQHVQQQLERMANRLEIKASQQAAWREYAEAHKAAFAEPPAARPPQDADAATLARHQAERAAEMARKLDRLASATASLQSALSPEQQQTLNQIVRQGQHRMMMHHGHGGPMGERMPERQRADGAPPQDDDMPPPPRPRQPAPAKK